MECRTYLWLNWVDSILECVQGSDLALCVWPKLNKLTPVDIENGCANSIDKSTWVRKRAWRAQAAGEGRGGYYCEVNGLRASWNCSCFPGHCSWYIIFLAASEFPGRSWRLGFEKRGGILKHGCMSTCYRWRSSASLSMETIWQGVCIYILYISLLGLCFWLFSVIFVWKLPCQVTRTRAHNANGEKKSKSIDPHR